MDAAPQEPSPSAEEPASGDQAEEIALKLLEAEAKKASEAKNEPRFDSLVKQILLQSQRVIDRTSHDVRMDRWRVVISLAMIVGLFAIIAIVIFLKASNGATQYVSLMSGLAGIALGWLFGTGAASNLRQLDGRDSNKASSRGTRRR